MTVNMCLLSKGKLYVFLSASLLSGFLVAGAEPPRAILDALHAEAREQQQILDRSLQDGLLSEDTVQTGAHLKPYYAWLTSAWPDSFLSPLLPEELPSDSAKRTHAALRRAGGVEIGHGYCEPTELRFAFALQWKFPALDRADHLFGVYNNFVDYLLCLARTEPGAFHDSPVAILSGATD